MSQLGLPRVARLLLLLLSAPVIVLVAIGAGLWAMRWVERAAGIRSEDSSLLHLKALGPQLFLNDLVGF